MLWFLHQVVRRNAASTLPVADDAASTIVLQQDGLADDGRQYLEVDTERDHYLHTLISVAAMGCMLLFYYGLHVACGLHVASKAFRHCCGKH